MTDKADEIDFKNKIADAARRLKAQIVGAAEKGYERAKLSRVTIKTDLDLSAIPNYVCYRAALIREKTLLQHVCVWMAASSVLVFGMQRCQISDLESKLRSKEFILAPGVSDFIPVAPQMVPDSYVQHAVTDLVSTLGNTNPTNIEERLKQLSETMSPALRVQFESELKDWVGRAHSEGISEMSTILSKTVESDGKGSFRALVRTRTDSFVGGVSIGFRNEVIDLKLKLVPPEVGRRWYLEITSLSRTSLEAFEAGRRLQGATREK